MDTVEQFYNDQAEREWQREDRHRTEFAVTRLALLEYLPPAPAKILDDGGGPGRYAIFLTQRGYDVTLLDLAQANLNVALREAERAGVCLADVQHGNALRLNGHADESYDAVLLMGPLYHLLDETERRTAIREARRVLKPGGRIFAAFINRYAGFRDCASRYPADLNESLAAYERIWTEGINVAAGGGFTDAYFADPDEVIPLVESEGFHARVLINCEGIAAGHEENLNALTGEAWERWLNWNYRFAKDAHLVGAADHLLVIAEKI